MQVVDKAGAWAPIMLLVFLDSQTQTNMQLNLRHQDILLCATQDDRIVVSFLCLKLIVLLARSLAKLWLKAGLGLH